MRLKSALRRGVAAAVIAGIVVSSGIPAYAKTWDIADGDITVKGASDESGNYNNVKQGEKDFEKDEGETVITGESDKNTVTIDTSEGNVDVTFDDLKIDVSGKKEGDGSGKTEVDGSGKTEVDGSGKTEGNVSDETEGDVSGDSPVDAGKAAVTVQGDHDAAIELDGANELKSGSCNAGLEKNGHESSGKLTIKDDNDTKGSLTAEGGKDGAGIGGGYESGAGNIEITGGTVEAVGGEGAAGIGGGVYGPGRDIEISGGKVSATGGSYSGDPRPGAAGIGDGAGAWSEIDPDAPSSNPNHIIISGDAEVEAKAGASTGGKTAAIGGGIVGEIPNDALSDDDHKVTGGSLTRYDPAGKKMENYSYDRRTPSQPEQPDDTENSDDEDDAPDTQTGEVPDRVKQMYEAVGVITHLDGTQELGDVTTAEYDPVNRVLSFDAHGSVFRMTGDSLRELAKEVHELRIRFLDGEGQEMEAVIPLVRIKDLVGVNGAFELELSQEGLYRFHVVGQTGYDRKTFSDETALRINGRELVLVYRVGDEEQKAQETARVEEAIARRKQEKKQWGTVLSGLEGSLSGQPELTQPGTGTVGGVTDSIADPKVTDMGSITVRLPGKPASDSTVWKTFTGNIVKLVSGKQDSKKDDPAPSVGGLSGPPTLSPDSLTTVQQPETIGKQPETIGQQPETIGQQPETGGWVTDSQGDWVWKPGKDDSRPPDLGGNWETSKWMGRSDYWWEWQPVQEGDQLYWKPILQTRIWWDPFYDSAWMYDYEG
ncbi:hypothetical protein KTF61_04000 [Faecalibacterium prausnitzii]|uniref:hypothetical protein n=1 Tax=Faecalibacterium prausnitzii TaxID=853 RepID=UPI001C267B56|nr:hypothetical protein [Faecalibacterium prausnitzii]MBU8988762.1 hypothetical protein [Faecalibacterium prausnitzii]MCQ5155230.1 hypothetical protein [Faecalibacterium prausnitzii]